MKLRNKLLSILLAVLMIIGAVPASALSAIAAGPRSIVNNIIADVGAMTVPEVKPTLKAEATTTNVAKVGNTEYATIDEAIANWTNGTTLTLLADVTLSDVIQLSSTEHHILDLGTYTMTAASKKDAIQIVNNGRSSASYALDIKADAENPGGITASGKAVVRTTGKSGVKDRPIIRFYNGEFTGTNVVYHSGSNGTNCPQFWFYGGEFNGTVYANRALFQFYGGTFNGNIQISVDSSAYALVSGGRFKKLSNLYGSSLNTDKFTIGSKKGTFDRSIYVDKDGYYVVTSEIITEVSRKYPAVKKESYNSNNYFYYSLARTYGMFYEVASMAGTGSNVTIYVKPAVTIPDTVTGDVVEEIKNNTALNDYTPDNLPAGAELEIELKSAEDKFVYDVTPMANGTEVEPTEAITFRLPVPASVTKIAAKVYHEDTLMGTYTIKGEGNAKYVEISSADFSEFAVEPTDTFNVAHGTLEVGPANTLSEAIECNDMLASLLSWNDPTALPVVTLNADFTITEDFTMNGEYAFVLDLNGKTLTVADGVTLSIGSNVQLTGEGEIVGDVQLTADEDADLNIADTVTVDNLAVVDANGNNMAKGDDGSFFACAAQIGTQGYATLEEAFAAAQAGETITLLADATPALTSQRGITKAAVIDLNGFTLTLKEDDLYFGTTEFKNGTIVVDPSVRPSTAVFWMFAGQTLTFNGVKLVATGVTGTYLIGLEGADSNLNILNGSEIVVENTTALDLDIICVNGSTGNDIVIKDSKVNVTNLDGRVFFRGNYTIGGATEIALEGITKAGFRIEAGQTLKIEDTASVVIVGEPRDGGIHLTDETATYTKAETATVTATLNAPIKNVAQIGTQGYATLADAIAAVKNGETIVLLDNIAENVTLTEKVGLYYTIDGNGKTMTGTITVTSLSDTDDNRRITIKNINFVDTTDANVDFISSVNTNHYPRLTVEGCTFTGSGNDGDVALRLKGSHSVVIKDCTGTGLHSFLQNTAGWNLTIENVKVTDSKSGFALGTVQGVTVKDCDISVRTYGVRMDAQYNNNAVIESNKVAAFIPVVVRKASVDSNITFAGTNTMNATNTDGLWCAIGTSEYEENGKMPSDPTGKITVTLADSGLDREGIYSPVIALDGSGTQADPYQISSVEELIFFRDSVNAGETKYNAPGVYVVLTADIDLSTVENWAPIGNWDYTFDGNFNGQGHKITNLKINDTTNGGYVGFFGITANNVIKNFTIENVTIVSGGEIVAAAIAYPYYTVVSDITVCGDIAIQGGNYTAGVLGYTRLCEKATNLTVSGNAGSYITGTRVVGGIIADIQMNHGLTADYSNFAVSGVTITGTQMVGGISGIISSQTLNGATVKNVELVCGDNYVGIVAGSLGGAAVINNVVYENVTGATAIVGNTYSGNAAVQAQIGNKYYTTLEEALKEAQAGETIVLLAPVVVAAGEVLTLNKAVTITYTSNVPGEDMITVRGKLIVDGATLIYNNNDTSANNVTVSTISCEPGSVLKVESGKVVNESANRGANGIYAYAIDLLTNGSLGDVTVTISGGKVISENYMAIRQFNNGTVCANTLNITGGYIYGAKRAIQVHLKNDAAHLTISGGKIEAGAGGYALCLFPENATHISVTGGEFIGTVYSGTNGFVTGGTFDAEVYSGYLVEGYAIKNNNGAWGVAKDETKLYIYNAEELKAFRDAVNAGNSFKGVTVYLATDIDLGNVEWTPIGTSNAPFKGVFNGQNHTISNLVVNGGSQSNQGFFGFTTDGEIMNLTINNAKVSGRLNVAVVAGTPYTSKFTNIKVTGHVEVNGMAYVGGVGGKNAYANWTDITVDVDATSYVKANSVENGNAYRTYVGGVIGFNGEGSQTYKNISSNIKVIGSTCDIGGIFGIAHYGNNFENIKFTGAVEAPADAFDVGGIAGVWYNQHGYTVTFENVTSTGTVTVGDVTSTGSVVGGAYNKNNNYESNSGSLIIDGQEQWLPKTVKTKVELQAAIAAAAEGDRIALGADIDYGTDQLAIAKAITLDLGGYTLTTRNAWGGMTIKGNATVKNGTIVHASNTAAIKVWNAVAFENLVIDVQGKGDAGKTIGGIVLQSGSTTRVGSIKNVTIKGVALTNGIETYNCGDATENVIGSMENVTITAQGTGMLISAPCGTATNCTISGGKNGIEIFIKGNYSASLGLVDSKVEGGVYAHDEFNNNPGVVNNGTLSFEVDEETEVDEIVLELARAENVEGKLEEIKDNAQAKVNNVYYATLAEAIKAAKAGDVVTVFAGTYAMPAMKAGITIVGEGDVVFEGTLSGTLENLTLKNIHIKGANAQRWAYAKGNLVFENVTFEATSVYALHFDGITAGATLTYKDCTIIGWAAMSGSPASCVFEGCTFKGNGAYGLIRTYFDATIKDCTFDVSNVNTNDIYEDGIHAVNGAKVTVNNCTNINGDMTAIVNVNGSSVVVLDGVEIKNLAKIGDTYYTSLADAIKAAQAGEIITLVADINGDVTINKSVTIDGADFKFFGTMNVNAGLTITVENVNFVNGGIDKPKAQKSTTGTYTIKNCTFDGEGTYAYPVRVYGAKNVIIEDCTVKNYVYSFLYIVSGTNSVSVKNVTVENCPNYAIYFASGVNNAMIEGLTVKNSNNGIIVNNTATRYLTIKDCKMENVGTAIKESSGTYTINCNVLGVNEFGGAAISQYANVAGAMIGNKIYSLADAFAVAQNGDVITLIGNIQLDAGLTNTKQVTLDLNGKTITGTDNATGSFGLITNKGELTIKDSVGGGAMTLTATNNRGWNAYSSVISNTVGGTLIVDGGTIEHLGGTDMAYAIDNLTNGKGTYAETIINGGLVKSTYRAIRQFLNGVEADNILTVNGGTIEGTNKAIWMQDPSKNANTGTLTVGAGATINGDVYLTVTAGSTEWPVEVSIAASAVNGNVLTSNVPYGYILENKDGKFIVRPATYVAEVNGVQYESIQAAIDAAQNGETVKLIKDINIAELEIGKLSGKYNSYFVVSGKSITIDLNGKTISGEYTADAMLVGLFAAEQNGHLTLKNGTVDIKAVSTVYTLITAFDSTASIVIESGTYKLDKASNSLVYADGSRIITVNGGTFILGNVGTGSNGSPWIFNVAGNNTGHIIVNGGTFNADVMHQHWEFEVQSEEGTYVACVQKNESEWTIVTAVAVVGEESTSSDGYIKWVGYATLADALAAAEDGETVKLIKDITVTDSDIITVEGRKVMFSVVGKNITLDMNGKTINVDYNGGQYLIAVVRVADGAGLTVTGNGKIDVADNGINVAYMFWKAGTTGYLTIENGTYHMDDAGDSMVYTNGSQIVTINGGYFTIDNIDTRPNQFPCIFNTAGQNERNIIINGGTFNDDINHQYYAFEALVAKEKALKNNGDGTWTVVDAVAYVGEQVGEYTHNVGYATFAEAFAAVKDGETITLLTDITLDVGFTNTKKITLDLNGKTITGTDNATGSFGLITNKGELTIKDSVGGGAITLKATNNRGWNAYSSVISNTVGGKLIVNGGTIEHLGGTDMAYAIDNLTNGKGTYAETVINGGLVKSTYRAIRQFLNGVEAQNILTVNGGTIEGANKSIWMQDPSKNANTGTLTVGENAVIKGDIYLFVTAGSTEWPVQVRISAAALDGTSTVVTGNVPEEYIVENKNGDWIVRDAVYVAQVGGVKYESLADAIKAATAGQTITLLADITEDVTITKDLTIDGAGFKYTGNIAVKGTTVDVVIKNVNFVNGTGYAITTNSTKSITVENCTVANYGFGFLYANKSTPTVVVKNVTVDNCNYGIHYVYGSNATIEDVTMTNVAKGLYIQNYADKTITIKNSIITSIAIWERSGYSGVQTFEFEGANTVGTLTASQYAKYVLTAADATVTAPEGANVTTTVENAKVVYEIGAYSVHVHTNGNAVKENEVAPNCTTEGSYDSVVYCTECGDELSRTNVTVDALGHTAGVAVKENEVAPDCTTEGSYDSVVYCTVCGCELSRTTEKVPAKGHSYDEGVVTAPTYEADGYTTYTCACGHSYTGNVVSKLTKVVISQSSLVLKEAIHINFSVSTNTLVEGKEYVAVIKKGDTVVAEIPSSEWTPNGAYMVFTQTGITAKEMADQFTVVIYDGELKASDERVDGVTEYVKRAIAGGVFTNSKYAKLATLLVDMLNYGAAAQTQWNYNADNLANAIVANYQSFATQTELTFGEDVATKASANYGSTTVSLKDRVILNFNFNEGTLEGAAKAIISFTDHYGNEVSYEIAAEDFTTSKGRTTIAVDRLAAADARCIVTCTFVDANGDAIDGIYAQDSIANYCARAIKYYGAGTADANIFESIMKYADAAFNNFKTK